MGLIMDAYVITDASFLERTNAAGVACHIGIGDHIIKFKGSVTDVTNPTHGEFIAAAYALRQLKKHCEDNFIQLNSVSLATDCASLIGLMKKGPDKNRRYHPDTIKLLKEVSKIAASLVAPMQMIKVKAHVEKDPSPLEKMHNEVDRAAKHAMATLMNEIEMRRKPSAHYTTLLPQTLLPGEYEKLEQKAYDLAQKGLSPRVITKLPHEGNPFADGVARFKSENPHAGHNLTPTLIPMFDSRMPNKMPKYHTGISGIDRIQTLDALNRLGYQDSLLLSTEEGAKIADLGRAFTGFQEKPETVNSQRFVKSQGQSQFLLTHDGSKRCGDYYHLSMRYAKAYDLPEQHIVNEKIRMCSYDDNELTI